ncbi:membrane protein [Moraxella bovoculi]|uniref:Membrane protein n=1 Tax=Moraxella bovoculi TaxID=386891 RepID=A0AAC8PYN1_9GAMM|nr:leucine efflux protein LeuE [Moraxella bovoculi]AKG08369.1 membrane protein [Moraxella bovoculi]AKG09073.1 membrane protein [Moraxella bovoculi]AKG10909.1 membrane protein [Moraxella bovoculi]AKG12900.1 membrane protein [Moraxella bovoculi]
MFGITDLTAYLIGVIIIITLPGPNSLYCLSVAASRGKRAGGQVMAGILVGDTILILATVFGAGTLLKLYPSVFDVIKFIGGCYLAYLGIRLIIGAYHTFKDRHLIANQSFNPPKVANQNYFYRSLSLSLTNPKAILFFLSFFVQFVSPTYDKPFLTFFVLAVILQLVSFLYLLLLVFSGKKLADIFGSRPLIMTLAMFCVGCLFIGFGVNLWLARL